MNGAMMSYTTLTLQILKAVFCLTAYNSTKANRGQGRIKLIDGGMVAVIVDENKLYLFGKLFMASCLFTIFIIYLFITITLHVNCTE
jgi:hypothetical protein